MSKDRHGLECGWASSDAREAAIALGQSLAVRAERGLTLWMTGRASHTQGSTRNPLAPVDSLVRRGLLDSLRSPRFPAFQLNYQIVDFSFFIFDEAVGDASIFIREKVGCAFWQQILFF